MTEEQTILRLLAEGGSITLLGTPTAQGWHFVLETNEGAALAMLDEGDAVNIDAVTRRDAGTSWETALAALGRYKSWHRFHRDHVYPDFAGRVEEEVRERRQREEQEQLQRRAARTRPEP